MFDYVACDARASRPADHSPSASACSPAHCSDVCNTGKDRMATSSHCSWFSSSCLTSTSAVLSAVDTTTMRSHCLRRCGAVPTPSPASCQHVCCVRRLDRPARCGARGPNAKLSQKELDNQHRFRTESHKIDTHANRNHNCRLNCAHTVTGSRPRLRAMLSQNPRRLAYGSLSLLARCVASLRDSVSRKSNDST